MKITKYKELSEEQQKVIDRLKKSDFEQYFRSCIENDMYPAPDEVFRRFSALKFSLRPSNTCPSFGEFIRNLLADSWFAEEVINKSDLESYNVLVQYHLVRNGLFIKEILEGNKHNFQYIDMMMREAWDDEGFPWELLVDSKVSHLRRCAAKRGVGIETLIEDTTFTVQCEALDQARKRENFPWKNYIRSKSSVVREEVAYHGVGIETLVDDESPNVRMTIARKGYMLDRLIFDGDPHVRAAVAQQGYGLDRLMKDPSPIVRLFVAKHGHNLEALKDDEDYRVRAAVASNGKHIEQLIEDEDEYVREVAKEKARDIYDFPWDNYVDSRHSDISFTAKCMLRKNGKANLDILYE